MKITILILSFVILAISPFYGQIDLSLSKIFQDGTMDSKIFFELRVPRVLLAFFIGGILALGGLIFQSVFKNPMATPFTLGVASGATLFTAIAIVFGFTSFVSLFAFIGALLTIVILFTLSSRFDFTQTSSLLLVGIALSFFYSAALMVLYFISNLEQSYEIMRFTMGSLDIVGFDNLYIVVFASIFLLLSVLFYKDKLQLLLTSYEFAILKGLNVKRLNYTLLFIVSISVAIAVSIVGPIGFVGLIIPHILKTIYKKSAHLLIVPIFFYGGVFLVFCDFIARNINTSSDVPIGVITSFLGAPFFIYLIIKK
ncbi:MAG TPA: iron ABC transporter permease [Arcobacter sp.]|nr:iron ABC transporter permease [Arcobacter sp.]HIP56159.1 iron ABC transporter permease [Arcobacter sp.]